MTVDPTFRSSEVNPDPYTFTGDRDEAGRWIDLLAEGQAALDGYADLCERVDELYADMDRLRGASRDREFNIFWANLEVLRPSIYARPPVPVVQPRFSDRKPLPRKAAEILERALVTLTVESDLHAVLKGVRDDVARVARGVPWVRMVDGEVEFQHVEPGDFLHDPARKWAECRWVARRNYVPVEDLGELFKGADLERVKPRDGVVMKQQHEVEVWEIWHKAEDAVVWVAEGYRYAFARKKPPVKLEGFFPCPKPAYGTVQPGSLIPVPDMVYYRDQMEEINDLTSRISGLTAALQVKGFYDSSKPDVGDAIQTALRANNDAAIMVPVPGMGALQAGAGGGLIEWMPIQIVAATIQQCIDLRRQLIDDVYQISGLSDIMRGSTDASETATAQNLKAQYGSVRIRERQEEMVRVARDLYRIAVELLAEKLDRKKLLGMAQIDDLPTDADIRKQVKAIEDQAKQAVQAVQSAMQAGQEVPQEQIDQQIAQFNAQMAQLDETITTDKVFGFISDQRLRAFALDVETDSTIAANEDAEKQRRLEFLGALGQFLPQAMQAVQLMPESAPLMAQAIRFVASGFRAREMDQVIDDFAEKVEEAAKQPRPDPNAAANAEAQAKAQAEQAKLEMEQAKMQADQQKAQADVQIEGMKAQADVALKQAQAAKVQVETQEIEMRLRAAGEALADQQFNEAMTVAAAQEFDAVVQQ